MGYPVAYRNRRNRNSSPRRGGGGSQDPANDNQPRPRPYWPAETRPPSPANDNQPVPANDNNPAWGGLTREALPYVRTLRRVARTANRLEQAWQVYRTLRYYYDANAMGPQPASNGVVDLPANWTEIFDCCPTLPMIGVSTEILQPFCISPCVMFPGSGGHQNGLLNPNSSQVGSWASDGSVYITGAQMITFRKLWGKIDPFSSQPFRYPRLLTRTRPEYTPQVDPFSQPVTAPRPNVRPLPWRIQPYRQPNPWRSPTEQSSQGYGTVYGRIELQEWPSVQIDYGNTPQVAAGPAHSASPPGGGVRERKVQVAHPGTRIALRLSQGVYAVTEALDALDAVERALPRQYRAPPGSTPQERALAIWRNYRHLDMNRVVLNLIANHLIDEVIGRSNARANRFLTRHGVRRGGAF